MPQELSSHLVWLLWKGVLLLELSLDVPSASLFAMLYQVRAMASMNYAKSAASLTL